MRLAAAVAALLLVPSQAIGASCDLGPVVRLTASRALDPACTYRTEFRITASNVTLDCRGSVLDGHGQIGFGVRVDSEGQSLRNVTVQNCRIRNYRLNGVWIGWGSGDREKRSQTADISEMYRRTPSAVRVIGSLVSDSGRVGIYVDDYTSDTTIALSAIERSGGPGIYLEHSSRRNRILFNAIAGNGVHSPREGLAIDSSADNLVLGNRFTGNKAGGVFLYKNCQERRSTDANSVRRWQFSNRNVIAGNSFDEPEVAVWIASRQSRDLSNWDCGDDAVVSGRIYRDYARYNLVVGNRFRRYRIGVRIEDDRNKAIRNMFEAPDAQAIVVGSRYLGRRLRNVTATDNYRLLPNGAKSPVVPMEIAR